MLMMKKTKNLEFEPMHQKNVPFASVLHGISCLFKVFPDAFLHSSEAREQKFGI
jgi:hypothetical protein